MSRTMTIEPDDATVEGEFLVATSYNYGRGHKKVRIPASDYMLEYLAEVCIKALRERRNTLVRRLDNIAEAVRKSP